MKITRPIEGVDLFIIYDVLSDNNLESLIKYAALRCIGNPDHVPVADDLQNIFNVNNLDSKYLNKGPELLESLRQQTITIMRNQYPDLNLVKFNDFGDVSIRTPHHQYQMKPHVDGPPELNNPDHGIKNLGSNYYLNDNYEGGELYYPNLNFTYKPKPNSLVIHRGTEEFRHGVAEVRRGIRFSFGMFAFENYQEDLFTMEQGLDSDN